MYIYIHYIYILLAPYWLLRSLATFSHIHVQAVSCAVDQDFGSNDRSAASIHALNSSRSSWSC